MTSVINKQELLERLDHIPVTRVANITTQLINRLGDKDMKYLVHLMEELGAHDNHIIYGGVDGLGEKKLTPDTGDRVNTRYEHLLLQNKKYPALEEAAVRMSGLFWEATVIEPEKDLKSFNSLSRGEVNSLLMVLAFFAVADTLVQEFVSKIFTQVFVLPECANFFTQQIRNERVHQDVYNNFLSILVTDDAERDALLHAYHNGGERFEPIKKKVEWLEKIFSLSNYKIGEKVVAQIAFEGICFASQFPLILRYDDNRMTQLVTANEYIRRDESEHCRFYIQLWKLMPNAPTVERTRELLLEAVNLELEMCEYALPENLSNVTLDDLKDHVRATLNIWLEEMELEPEFYDNMGKILRTPLRFMNKFSSGNKTNFFDRHVTEYNVRNTPVSYAKYDSDSDFSCDGEEGPDALAE